MGTIEDIRKMQQEGKSEQEIANSLKQTGLPENDIYNSIAQAKIKDAVSGNEAQAPQQNAMNQQTMPNQNPSMIPQAPQTTTQMSSMPQQPIQSPQQPMTQEYSGMSPSMMDQSQDQMAAPQPGDPYQGYPQDYSQEGYDYSNTDPNYSQEGGYSDYYSQGYQQSPSLSSDTITEIADQAISEKLSPLTNKIEKTIDLKTKLESKIETLSERLQRIEKIIDKLQLSILDKIGEHIADTSNIKKELIETQKSFKAIHKPRSHSHHKKKSKKK